MKRKQVVVITKEVRKCRVIFERKSFVLAIFVSSTLTLIFGFIIFSTTLTQIDSCELELFEGFSSLQSSLKKLAVHNSVHLLKVCITDFAIQRFFVTEPPGSLKELCDGTRTFAVFRPILPSNPKPKTLPGNLGPRHQSFFLQEE